MSPSLHVDSDETPRFSRASRHFNNTPSSSSSSSGRSKSATPTYDRSDSGFVSGRDLDKFYLADGLNNMSLREREQRPPPKNSTLLRTVDRLLGELEDCMHEFDHEAAEDQKSKVPEASPQHPDVTRLSSHQRTPSASSFDYIPSRSSPHPSSYHTSSSSTLDSRRGSSTNSASLIDIQHHRLSTYSDYQHPSRPSSPHLSATRPSSPHLSANRPARNPARNSFTPSDQQRPISHSRSTSTSSGITQHTRSTSFDSSRRSSLAPSSTTSHSTPFTTPKTLATLSAHPLARSGHMSKHYPAKLFSKSWKPRFFVLNGSKLWIFKSSSPNELPSSYLEFTPSAMARVSEKGVWVLEVVGTGVFGDGVMVPLTKVEKTWMLQCKGKQEMMDWLDAFKRVIAEVTEAAEEDRRGRSGNGRSGRQRNQSRTSQSRSKSRARSQHSEMDEYLYQPPSMPSPSAQHLQQMQGKNSIGMSDYFDPRFRDVQISGSGSPYAYPPPAKQPPSSALPPVPEHDFRASR